MIEQKVELGSRSYGIHIGEGAFEESLKTFGRIAAGGRKIFWGLTGNPVMLYPV